jgi:hypothetical protein
MAKMSGKKWNYESLEREGDALEGKKCWMKIDGLLTTGVQKVRASEIVITVTAGRITAASRCCSLQIEIGAFDASSTTARGRCFGPLLLSSDVFLIPSTTRKNAAMRMTLVNLKFLFMDKPMFV